MPRISETVRDERRQQLIQGAWRCAARKGYRDTTVDDVCAETGLSKGAFYGYFDSKQALLLALLEEDAGAVDLVLDELDAEELGSLERLRRFTRATLAKVEDPAHVQVRAALWTAMMTEQAVRARFAEVVQRRRERRRERLRTWIEIGIANGELEEIPANAFASGRRPVAHHFSATSEAGGQANQCHEVRSALRHCHRPQVQRLQAGRVTPCARQGRPVGTPICLGASHRRLRRAERPMLLILGA